MRLSELDDVPLDAFAQLRAWFGGVQLDRHAQSRQRAAQLVRGRGEHRALHRDERLDPLRGAIEAVGERSDFVPAFHLDPGSEIALTERVPPVSAVVRVDG